MFMVVPFEMIGSFVLSGLLARDVGGGRMHAGSDLLGSATVGTAKHNRGAAAPGFGRASVARRPRRKT
jgi:cystathionine beta-lyase family protein involved in aluminum resistance